MTKFILSLPPDLPTKAVVEQARAKGHTTTASNVLRVRGIAKLAGKKTATKSLSKSDFIRTQPGDLPAAEVIANAKRVGIQLQAGLIYEVRAADRRRAEVVAKQTRVKVASPPGAKKKPATPKPVPATLNGAANSPEDLLRAVASEIGLGRALAFLQEQRRQVLRVLDG